MPIYDVLIVEDNPLKQQAIEEELKGTNLKFLSVRTIGLAYKLLPSVSWDLILLDMTFNVSNRSGFESRKESLAGVELLQFLARRQLDIPVIVATQHNSFVSNELPDIKTTGDLHDLLIDAFPYNYRATVEIDLHSNGWRTALRGEIRKILTGVKFEDTAG